MPFFRAAVTVAFGVIGLGMLVASALVFVGARHIFVGLLLAAIGIVALVIAYLMRRYR